MSGDGRDEFPAEFLDLVDDYCSGSSTRAGIATARGHLLGHVPRRVAISRTISSITPRSISPSAPAGRPSAVAGAARHRGRGSGGSRASRIAARRHRRRRRARADGPRRPCRRRPRRWPRLAGLRAGRSRPPPPRPAPRPVGRTSPGWSTPRIAGGREAGRAAGAEHAGRQVTPPGARAGRDRVRLRAPGSSSRDRPAWSCSRAARPGSSRAR